MRKSITLKSVMLPGSKALLTALLLIICASTAQAQYNSPIGLALNEASDTYYISNEAGDFILSSVSGAAPGFYITTGLTAPRRRGRSSSAHRQCRGA